MVKLNRLESCIFLSICILQSAIENHLNTVWDYQAVLRWVECKWSTLE